MSQSRIHNGILYSMLGVALIGLLDATYLTATHLMDTSTVCNIIDGCDVVLASTYAEVVGIPTAAFGLLFYILVIGGLLWYIVSREQSVIRMTAGLTFIGFVVSLVLIYIQVEVLRSFCQYCILSALTSTILAVMGGFMLFGKEGNDKPSSHYEAAQ